MNTLLENAAQLVVQLERDVATWEHSRILVNGDSSRQKQGYINEMWARYKLAITASIFVHQLRAELREVALAKREGGLGASDLHVEKPDIPAVGRPRQRAT